MGLSNALLISVGALPFDAMTAAGPGPLHDIGKHHALLLLVGELPFDAMTAAGAGPLHDVEMDTKRLGFSQWCA